MYDRHLPAVIWAQRNDKLYVTINVEDCQNAAVNFEDSKLTFRYCRHYSCLFSFALFIGYLYPCCALNLLLTFNIRLSCSRPLATSLLPNGKNRQQTGSQWSRGHATLNNTTLFWNRLLLWSLSVCVVCLTCCYSCNSEIAYTYEHFQLWHWLKRSDVNISLTWLDYWC